MPTYVVRCSWCRTEQDIVRTVAERDADLPVCHGRVMERILTAPSVFVKGDVHYASPVDGRPITNYQQHLEELARTDCVVYESGIKQDQERNARMRDEALERSVDETVDREIATMPALKKEKLVAELEGGLTATPERVTPPSRAIVTKLEFPRS